MTKIKKVDAIKIFQIFILIQPILNVLIYFLPDINFFSVIRPLFLGIIFLMVFFNEKTTKKMKLMSSIYLSIFVIYSVIHILVVKNNFYEKSYGNLLGEIKYLIYYLYYILLIVTSYITYKIASKDEKNKILKCIVISIITTIVMYYISLGTGTSRLTYGSSVVKFGWCGWSNSVHHIGHVIILSLSLVIISIFEKNQINNWIKFIIFFAIILCGYYLIGTKSATYGTLLLVGFYGLIRVLKLLKREQIVRDSIFVILTVGILFVVLSKTFGFKNMMHQSEVGEQEQKFENYQFNVDAYDEKGLPPENIEINSNSLSLEYRVNYVIGNKLKENIKAFDNRHVQGIVNEEIWKISPMSEKLFGYGFETLPLNIWVETDFHIIYYCFGIFGLIILIGLPIVYLLYQMIKNIKNIKKLSYTTWILGFNVCLNIGMVITVGYILYFAQTAIYFVLPLTMLYVELEEYNEKIPVHDK